MTESLLEPDKVPDGTSQMYFDHKLRLIPTLSTSTNTGHLIIIHLLIPEENSIMVSSMPLTLENNLDYLSLNCQDSVKESFPHIKDVSLLMTKVKLNVNNNKITFSVFVPTGLLTHSRENNSIS